MEYVKARWADKNQKYQVWFICDNKREGIAGVDTFEYENIVASGITIDDYAEPAETWDSIRGERDRLLKNTDWQGMSDVTMSDAQTAYRKKLRDLPATNADPTKIVFPDAP